MTPTADQSDRPFPPRFRQLRRWSSFTLLIFAGLVGLRFAWGVHAEHARRDFIAQAHARGEKVVISDWIRPHVPDQQNAAYFLLKAVAAIPNPDRGLQYKTPLSTDDLKSLQRLISRSTQVISNVRHARNLKKVDWGIKYASPAYTILLPNLNAVRYLAFFEKDLALYAHATGNDCQAIELLRDMLFCSRCLDRLPFLVPHLIALAMYSGACDCLMPMIPQLEVAPPSKSSNASTRPQVQALLADLLDASPIVQSNAAAWQGEAMGFLDIGYHPFPLGGGPRPNNPLLRLLLPIATLDCVRDARGYQSFANAATRPTYPEALGALPTMPVPTRGSMLYWITRLPTYAYMIGSPARPFSSHYSTLARMRRTATQLAIRLYTLDHGHAPPSLQALVPDYLPYVPTDPMAAGNQPIITSAATHPSTSR